MTRVQVLLMAILLSLTAGFAAGFYTCHQFNKADQVDAARETTQQVIQQADVSNKVEAKHEAAQVRIRTIYKTIVKEVPRYVTIKADAECPIPNSFVGLWNRASTGAFPDPAGLVDETPSAVRLSDVAEQHTADAEQYYEVAGQLEALQDWVAAQQRLDATYGNSD